MHRFVLACAFVAVAATSVVAQSDVIKERQQVMKGIGNATKEPGGMLKGEVPFNLAKVQAALATYPRAPRRCRVLFPENSKTGGDTAAAPAIWSDMNGFKAAFAKFDADATKAAAEIKDEASFKANFPAC